LSLLSRRRALIVLATLTVTPAYAQGGDPAAPIAVLNAGLLASMKAGHATPFAQRAATLRPVIEAAFDLDTILRTSVGAKFASLPAADQTSLREAFGRYTVDSYAGNFDSFSGEKFAVLPNPRAVGADRVVATTLQQTTGAPIKLDYVMRSGPAGWRAVDVLLDGSISRVAVQRSDFRALVAGGTAAPLIARLQAKAAALEAGAKG